MTNDLEARYRRCARWYPTSWRAENEDALIGTLLDVAEAEGRTAPSCADRWNLARNAVVAHGDTLAPSNVRDAVAANAVALCGAFALIYFLFVVWAPFLPGRELRFSEAGFGPFLSTGVFTATAAFGLHLATLLRQRWLRTPAAVVTIVTALITVGAGRVTGDAASAAAVNVAFLALLAAASLIGTPRRSRTTALVTAGWIGGMVAALAANHQLLGTGERGLWVHIANPYSVPTAAMLALIVSIALLGRGRELVAAVTASAAVPWLSVSLFFALDAANPENLTIAIHASVIAAATAITFLALHRITRRREAAQPS